MRHSQLVSSVETLEPRRLMAGEAWGPISQLAGLDGLADRFPLLTGAGQTIAVLDSGIDYGNPILGGGFGPGYKVVDGFDFVDNDSDPSDTHGHGTLIAGIIAADEYVHDSVRYRGVAPAAQLAALRVNDGIGSAPDETMAAALQWVRDNRVRLNITVVNLSLGYGNYTTATPNSIFGDELAGVIADGIIVIAASGNGTISNGPGQLYPSIEPNVISVGAVDRFDTVAEFTQRSAALNLLAPGTEVEGLGINGSFITGEGTSFAAPFVAGAAAILKQVDANFGLADVRSILLTSGHDNLDGDDEFGATTGLTFARLDLAAMAELATVRKTNPAVTDDILGQHGNNNDLQVDRFGLKHFVWFDSSELTMKYAVQTSGGTWSTITSPDTTGTSMGEYVSLAFDPRGRPALAYFDGQNGDARFAKFVVNGWQRTTVESSRSVGLYPQLAFDGETPRMFYYARTLGDLREASFANGTWTIGSRDSEGDVGRSGSLARDGDGHLALAYEDSTNGDLKFLRDTGSGFTRETVDNAPRGVSFISLAFNRQGKAAISYYDAYPADLKIARQVGAAWDVQVLSVKGAVGLYTKTFFDASDRANVLYYNRGKNSLNVLERTDSGAWSNTLIRTNGGRYTAGAVTSIDGVEALVFATYDGGARALKLATYA